MVGLVAQDGAAGMVGDDCGDAHQARAGASARASSWEKASRPAGQGHDQAPDTVLSEPLQGEAVKSGVFRAADAVLAAGP